MDYLFDGIEEATAALIIQLQLEDSEELVATVERKGKGREDELSDIQLALQLFREDMQRYDTVIKDRQMTKSIAKACQTDGNIVSASRSEEQTSADDHEMACRLSGQSVEMPIDRWTVTAEEMDEELMAKLTALYVAAPTEQRLSTQGDYTEINGEGYNGIIAGNEAESSTWGAARNPEPLYRTCESCREHVRFYDVARVPCGHEYCRECLRELYSHAMTDDTLFPPRCCRQPITSGGVRLFLTSELIHQYEKKKIELDTPNRTYCSNPLCSVFINLKDIANDQAVCPECDTVTCTMCKLEGHSGDCPADLALQQVLDTANEKGWQRCFKCRGLVELEHGCNHMTCRCGGQFCYICGLQWKMCNCAQWNEDRLLARANVVVARQPLRPNAPQHAAALAQAVQNLRTRHNCDHENWQYVVGQHQCEECYHTLPSYIFECRQCRIQACNRCRRNRL